MSAVVHKMRALAVEGKIDAGPKALEPVCGGLWRETTLFAVLAHGSGYRWCKKCLRKIRQQKRRSDGQ